MKIRTFLKIFFISLLLYMIVMPIRGPYLGEWGGFQLSGLVGFTLYLVYTIICIESNEKKLNVWLIVFAVLAGRWIFELPLRVVDFWGPIISFPESLVQTLGIICGTVFWKLKPRVLAYAVLTLCSGLALFMYVDGYDYWLQKLNSGTFTGNVSYAQPEKFNMTAKDGSLLTDADIRGKYVLLDFWNTQCGICFRKFPQLQALYVKYQNNPSVKIYAVNKKIDDDKPGEAFTAIEEAGYTFPVVLPEDNNFSDKFGVVGYPETYIIDPQGTVVFKGDIAFARGKLDSLVKQ